MDRNQISTLSIATLLAVAFASAPMFGCSSSDPGLGPAETVEHVAAKLADGHPIAIWEALPASYQSDVSGILSEFSAKMDRKLWNKTFGVVAKFTRLLTDKQQLILEHPMMAQQVAASGSTDVEADWKGLVGLVDLLATSELADLDKLATLDIAAFLNGTGEQFVRQAAALSKLAPEGGGRDYVAAAESLQSVKATLVSEEDGRATVRIEVAGQEPRTETLVPVEEKWIPAELAEGWQARLAEARESISKMSSEESKPEKQATLLKLAMVEGMLDSLLAAETSEQFNAAIGSAIGGMMGMAMQASMNQQNDMNVDPSAADEGVSIRFSPTPGSITVGADGAELPASIGDDLSNISDSQPASTVTPEDMAFDSDDVEPSTPSLSIVTPSTGLLDTPKIPIGDAQHHLGNRLRVVAPGMDVVATLASADGDTLVFHQALKTGVMSFRVRKNEIESLRAAR